MIPSEIRQAFRTLSKSPGFSALVIIVLSAGIGANAAIFSIVNGVLLKPLPFANAGALVAVETTIKGEPDDTSYPDFLDWHAQAASFDGLAVYAGTGATLTGVGEATGMSAAVVSPDMLSMLGVPPQRGRTFTADDDKPGAPRTVVITDALWTKRFSRDEGIIGRSITLSGDLFTVVGVMPAGFEFPFDAEDPPQLWMPVRASRFAANWAEQRNASFLHGVGRLKPGASLASAQADMSTIAARLADQYPRNKSRGVVVRSYQDVLVKDYRLGLIVLLSAVAAVLLIACANIANLLLARGSGRRREIAVRTALGASRGRIARQLIAESLLLAAAGGVGGVLLAAWGVRLLVSLSPLQIPRLHDVHVDGVGLFFTVAISIVAGVLSGLVPAFQLSRTNLGEALKDGDRGGSGAAATRTRQVLVVAEMAISLVLLASAGLLVRSLVTLQSVNPGFVTERSIAMQLQLPGARYPDANAMRNFYRRLRDEVRALPGVTASAIATAMPMSGSDIGVGFTIEGRPVDPTTRLSAEYFGISPDYFSTMGIPVLKGRGFTERDIDHAPEVIVINDTMAAKYWPNEDPLGKRLTIGYNNSGPREVVGVVAGVKRGTLADPTDGADVHAVRSDAVAVHGRCRPHDRGSGDGSRIDSGDGRSHRSDAGGGRVEDARAIRGAHSGDAAVHGLPGRRIRRVCAAAGGLRAVQRDGVLRCAAAAGNRYPHGARRAAVRRQRRWWFRRPCAPARLAWQSASSEPSSQRACWLRCSTTSSRTIRSRS